MTLTLAQRADIVRRHADGETAGDLAREHGVSRAAIWYHIHRSRGIKRPPRRTVGPVFDPLPIGDCAGSGVDFHPETPAAAMRPLAICRGCAVQLECLTAAHERGESHGVWGGVWLDARQHGRPRKAS